MSLEKLSLDGARKEFARTYGPHVKNLNGQLYTGIFIGMQPSHIHVEICVDGLAQTVQDQIVALLPVSFKDYPVEIRLMEQGELGMSEKNRFLHLS